MAKCHTVRISQFRGVQDDGAKVEPGRAIDGENFFATKDGHLRPGPGRAAFSPGDCYQDAVLDDPTAVTVATLRDVAAHAGNIWLNKWRMQMQDPHNGFDLGNTPIVTPQSVWGGRYFDTSELDTDDVRTRTLKLSLEEQGVTRVWVLDDYTMVDNGAGVKEPAWTSDDDSSCGSMRTEFDGLLLELLDPVLVIYDTDCYELTGWLHWEFDAYQGAATADDFVMGYDFEVGLLATTGTVRSVGRSYALEVTGSEEESAAQNALMVGLPRWPMLDREMLQDPNLMHLGVCAPGDAAGACRYAYQWTHEVWCGYDPGDDDAFSDASVNNLQEVWLPSIDTMDAGSFAKPFARSHTNSRIGVTLCEFIDWAGGPYNHVHDVQWSTQILNGGETWYSDELLPTGHQQNCNFVHIWKGKVCVPVEGRYRFYCMSDDAAMIKIDGEQLLFIHHFGDDSDRHSNIKVGSVVTNEHRAICEKHISSGEHMIELRWMNVSPSFVWHVAICPKSWASIPASKPTTPTYLYQWQGTQQEWENVFPVQCTDTLPDDAAPCCRGLDPLIGCEIMITELHVTTDAADAADFASATIEPIEDVELSDCYEPLVTI